MSITRFSEAGQSASRILQSHVDYLHELPSPPETFYASDDPAEGNSTRRRLIEAGIIEKAGHESQEDGDTEYRRNKYCVAMWAHEKVREIVSDRETLCPCGHGGVRNCGEHFECGFALCDQQFDRDELEES